MGNAGLISSTVVPWARIQGSLGGGPPHISGGCKACGFRGFRRLGLYGFCFGEGLVLRTLKVRIRAKVNL